MGDGTSISEHDANIEHECDDRVGCRTVHQIVAHIKECRATLVVPDEGPGMFITTLPTDETLAWLEQVAAEVRRTGALRRVHYVNRPT